GWTSLLRKQNENINYATGHRSLRSLKNRWKTYYNALFIGDRNNYHSRMIYGRKDIKRVLGGGWIYLDGEVSTSGSSKEFGYYPARDILKQYYGDTKKIKEHTW
ncbi:hypothetical protein HYT55_05660, partial [Candidatus Woesearchaeota archaeon]|nr:hypothetical protein [Candidatus Woesearchaeota archaeon]